MFRFLFRFVAAVFLAVAIIALIVDATRSISVSQWIFTPLGALWYEIDNGSLNLVQALVQRYLHPAIWDPGIQTLLTAPAFAAFFALAFLFYLLGRKPAQRIGRFAAR